MALYGAVGELSAEAVTVMPKVREAIRVVEADGWYLVRTTGDHRQYKHATKRGTVTIAGKEGRDLAPGTWNSVLKQAGLKGEQPR